MKVAVFLETNWNLTVLFAYMHKKNIKHVTIISSQKIVMPLPNSIPIESYTIFDNKVRIRQGFSLAFIELGYRQMGIKVDDIDNIDVDIDLFLVDIRGIL